MPLENTILKDFHHFARLLNNGTIFTAFDTETTGLKSETCRIIEIGAVQFDKNGIIKTFSTLINPLTHIPKDCSEVNHITDEMVYDKPTIDKILPDFVDFLNDTIIIGHNVQFDLRFLMCELERCDLPLIKNQAIDTVQFCRWTFPELKKYSQGVVADFLGIDKKNAHRASDDAKVCGNIFLECIKASANRQKL